MALTFKQVAALRAMQALITGCNDYDPNVIADSAWEIAKLMDEHRKQDEAECFNYPAKRRAGYTNIEDFKKAWKEREQI